mgnify:CR=1 FL=1|tara:strand:- start:4076 stop:5233 length:1158 start_codon:yes stop_codon:yes gene_type:complete
MTYNGPAIKLPRIDRGKNKKNKTPENQRHFQKGQVLPIRSLIRSIVSIGKTDKIELLNQKLENQGFLVKRASFLSPFSEMIDGSEVAVIYDDSSSEKQINELLQPLRAVTEKYDLPLLSIAPSYVSQNSIQEKYMAGTHFVLRWPEEIKNVKNVLVKLSSIDLEDPFSGNPEEALRNAVKNRLSILEKESFDSTSITVYRDTVMAEGFVNSYWKKWILKRNIQAIPGVSGALVTSVQVKPKVVKSDAQLRTDVLNTVYKTDPQLLKTVEVSVTGGRVVCRGTAPSERSVELLKDRIAKIQSVRQLSIAIHSELGLHRSDLEISRKVSDALRPHKETCKDLSITVRGRVAVLKGIVRSKFKMNQLVKLMGNIPEIANVENKLKLES